MAATLHTVGAALVGAAMAAAGGRTMKGADLTMDSGKKNLMNSYCTKAVAFEQEA